MNNADRIADLESVLRDLAFGAQMMLQVTDGAFASYAREVKRVAEAGLGYCMPTIPIAPVHLPSVQAIDEMFAKIMGAP